MNIDYHRILNNAYDVSKLANKQVIIRYKGYRTYGDFENMHTLGFPSLVYNACYSTVESLIKHRIIKKNDHKTCVMNCNKIADIINTVYVLDSRGACRKVVSLFDVDSLSGFNVFAYNPTRPPVIIPYYLFASYACAMKTVVSQEVLNHCIGKTLRHVKCMLPYKKQKIFFNPYNILLIGLGSVGFYVQNYHDHVIIIDDGYINDKNIAAGFAYDDLMSRKSSAARQYRRRFIDKNVYEIDFNESLMKDVDFIINTVNDIELKFYIDEIAEYYKKPLFDITISPDGFDGVIIPVKHGATKTLKERINCKMIDGRLVRPVSTNITTPVILPTTADFGANIIAGMIKYKKYTTIYYSMRSLVVRQIE
ncbi:MAG: ThiF family adenylyltransferase [Promethearchaeota archaeon]|nr:MAG: ubiquitin-activating enzyme [Helarchaeota virus Nidhogg Meg22_1012]URC17454.1 MAG: ubiquitin-activating enyzme [Helarchaeota virus Nidhogg Meg22_1214]